MVGGERGEGGDVLLCSMRHDGSKAIKGKQSNKACVRELL